MRARRMRADPTRAEEALWDVLRGRRLAGVKFRRQVPLRGFILDFVSFERRVIVEVDGWQHIDSVRDVARDALFRAEGFCVLRFANEDVLDDLDSVRYRILAVIHGVA